MDFFVILIVKLVSFILKLFGKNGGNLLDKIAKKMDKDILKNFKFDCPVIAVTATNGKTTTNNCIRYTLEKNGKKVISNSEGNNMETGIISVFIKNCDLKGRIKADFITLEVDESYVPVIFKKIRLDTLVVLDFFRDQLDRNGEVETLILKINEFLKSYQGNLVLNNDDPNVARLGKANPDNNNVYYFSVDKYEYATEEEREAGEGKFCPFDKTKLVYEYYQYSHIGKFHCPECGYGNENIFLKLENVDVKNGCFDAKINKTIDDEVNSTESEETLNEHYETLANSIYTIYNFSAVLTIAKLYHLDAKESLSTFKLNNGRGEVLEICGCKTHVNLAKNPTGANVSLRNVNEDEDEKELLFVLNDNIADGFDVSWIWDINFDVQKVTRIVTAGQRAYDIAIRIKTNGYDQMKIEPYLNLNEAVQSLYKTKTKKYVIANYTALQPTRTALLKYKE